MPCPTTRSVHRGLDHVLVLNGVCAGLAAWQGLQYCLVRQTRQNWVLHTGCGLDSHKASSGSAPKERVCLWMDGWMEGWMGVLGTAESIQGESGEATGS